MNYAIEFSRAADSMIENPRVGGSIPPLTTNKIKQLRDLQFDVLFDCESP